MDGVQELIFKARRTPSSHFFGQCIHCGQLIPRKISKNIFQVFITKIYQIRFTLPLGIL